MDKDIEVLDTNNDNFEVLDFSDNKEESNDSLSIIEYYGENLSKKNI